MRNLGIEPGSFDLDEESNLLMILGRFVVNEESNLGMKPGRLLLIKPVILA